MNKCLKTAASVAALVSLITLSAAEAQAQRRGGGGGGAAARSSSLRSSASGTVNRAGTRDTASRSGSRDARDNRGSGDRNINNSGNRTNINTGDINIDRDVDIDVDHGWGCCDNDYNGWGAFYAGAVVGAAVTRAAVVGAYYSTLPTNCVIVTRTTVTYYQCGSVWYQPVYSGMTVQYVVVTAP